MHSGSRDITLARLVVVRFIRVHVGSLGRSQWEPGLPGWAWVRSGAHSRFILIRLGLFSAPRGRRVHSGVLGFTQCA